MKILLNHVHLGSDVRRILKVAQYSGQVGFGLSTLKQKTNTFLARLSYEYGEIEPLTGIIKWHKMGSSGGKWEINRRESSLRKTL